MDPPVPEAIKDFLSSAREPDLLGWLCFQDWFSEAETQAADWIPVARKLTTADVRMSTFSALLRPAKGLENVLAKADWDVEKHLGHPCFFGSFGSNALDFDPGDGTVVDGDEFRPFVLYSTFHGYRPARFEIVQSFLLYHEAFKDHDGVYRRLDDAGELHPVLRDTCGEDGYRIEVDTRHLRDYLAAYGCHLVRYHEHWRYIDADIEPYMDGEYKRLDLAGELSMFRLDLCGTSRTRTGRSFCWLLGKDVIPPYDAPDSRHTSWAVPNRKEEYTQFVIGLDSSGHRVEWTCDEEELDNKAAHPNSPGFLTPVFFDPKVLKRYHDEPSKFTVDGAQVKCLDLWSITYDTNDEGLVYVWLGDLGWLPLKEQAHWKVHNLAPRGGITEHRYRRDFLGEFAEPGDDPVYNFQKHFDACQEAAQEELGAALFLPLKDGDCHHFEGLRVPLTEEQKEFDEQIQALAKILPDSLNKGLLKKQAEAEVENDKPKGTLDLLEAFVESRGADKPTTSTIMRPLRTVQQLRSSGMAHRKGDKYARALTRSGLLGKTYRDMMRTLLTQLAVSLRLLACIIQPPEDGHTPSTGTSAT